MFRVETKKKSEAIDEQDLDAAWGVRPYSQDYSVFGSKFGPPHFPQASTLKMSTILWKDVVPSCE